MINEYKALSTEPNKHKINISFYVISYENADIWSFFYLNSNFIGLSYIAVISKMRNWDTENLIFSMSSINKW